MYTTFAFFGHRSQAKVTAFFNRWGNTVFGVHSLPISWDGRFRGKEMEPGVYVYVVKFIEENDIQIHSGSLTLVR
jgi:gliding motility-associated-like protein